MIVKQDQSDDRVRKVCVVVTARPSYSRVRSALYAIQQHPKLELQLVVAASALLDRYGNVMQEIENDGFQVAERVFMVLEGENPTSMAKTTGIGVMELSTVFLKLEPDVVVTIADRYETIATAIAGSYMNISVAHIQGGEVTGSIDEKVRHAVTKLSDIHLVASENARQRVIRLGENPDQVFCTGCPSTDIAAQIAADPELDFDPIERYGGVGKLKSISDDYVVVMQHPVTTEYADSRRHVEMTLRATSQLGMPVLWFWPNVDAGSDGTSTGIRSFRERNDAERFHFFKNMSPTDFLKLLLGSRCLIGNSSVGIRECAYLGVPVVNIGSRQSGRQRGLNVIDVDYDEIEILAAARKQANHGRYASDPIYGDGSAGIKIAEVLATCQLSISKTLSY
ncbi:UDP-N-acetylglucosamine 2-epimerase [Stieleria varia]|uniref:UDP-N,N'-diacetylbacillosamine 2-epimerase (Hydrolyzing) n=1 Tax=Stieleria varia TaxID=2528005 RepID=A0A5C6AGT0_9BACT|nr:UDP-N-acetylglucosamine 2-epimerase [Stieleria varia]TWT98637.1 UDP-N,N'-diacetylbacillosamine 2-epimerase (hydrolyzing) [Stieleria varia]